MLTIGIAGQIASGKSEVAKAFAKRGALVISGDKLGQEIINSPKVKSTLIRKFSREILQTDNSINRRKLGQLVFGSKKAKREFDRIVQPSLLRTIRNEIKLASRAKQSLMIVIDAALIFNWGLEKSLDFVIVVESSKRSQIRRLTEKGLSRSQAENRIRAQMSKSRQRKKADFVVRNSGTLSQLRKKSEQILETLNNRPALKSR